MFLNPVIGFIHSFRNLNAKYAWLAFIGFYALYGVAQSFTLQSADVYRIGLLFQNFNLNAKEVFQLYTEGILPDLYSRLMMALIKRFTGNPKFLFCVYEIIGGLFAFLSLRQLYRIDDIKLDKLFYLGVFCYFIQLTFFYITGVRFYTAAGIFSFCAIQLLYYKRRKFWIGILITPLIHFSFLLPGVIIVLWQVIKNLQIPTSVFYAFMFLSFGVSLFVSKGAIEFSGVDTEEFFENEALQSKTNAYSYSEQANQTSYYNDSSLSAYRQANNIFTSVTHWVYRIGIFAILSILFIQRSKTIQTRPDLKFFNFVLFSFGWFYISTIVFSEAQRFITLGWLFLVFYLVVLLVNNKKLVRPIIYIMLGSAFYYILYLFINMWRVVDNTMWILPYPFTFIKAIGFRI